MPSANSSKLWSELYCNEHMLTTCLANHDAVVAGAVLREALREETNPPLSGAEKRLHALRMACKRLSCMNTAARVSIKELKYTSYKVDRMEGHVMLGLLNRYLVVIGGWGAGFSNQICMLDTQSMPPAETGGLLGIDCLTSFPEPWVFSYGFSCVMLCPPHEHENEDFDIHGHVFSGADKSSAQARQSALRTRLVFFGGCTEGGYSGDTSGLFYVDIQFFKKAPSPCHPETPLYSPILASEACCLPPSDLRVEARFSAPSPSRCSDNGQACSRGYHSANVVRLGDGRTVHLVWGGLHHNRPVGRLEFYDLSTGCWQRPTPSQERGNPPSERFGHSSVYVPTSRTLLLCGGSDGNNLTRNGRELRDLHVLQLLPGGGADEGLFSWSKVRVDCPSIINGRCHSCALVDKRKVIYFGGAAGNTNEVSIVDLENLSSATMHLPDDTPHHSTSTVSATGSAELIEQVRRHVDPQAPRDAPSNVHIYRPRMFGLILPHKRVSSAGAAVGRYFYIQGGWNNSLREFGDLWRLDLAYGVSSSAEGGEDPLHELAAAGREYTRYTTPSAAFFGGGGDDEDEDDDGDGDDNDYDDDDDYDYDGGMAPMEALLSLYGGAVGRLGFPARGYGEEEEEEEEEGWEGEEED